MLNDNYIYFIMCLNKQYTVNKSMSSAKDFKFFTVSHNGNLTEVLLRNEFCLVFFS